MGLKDLSFYGGEVLSSAEAVLNMNLNSQYALEATEAMKLRGLGSYFGAKGLKSLSVRDPVVPESLRSTEAENPP